MCFLYAYELLVCFLLGLSFLSWWYETCNVLVCLRDAVIISKEMFLSCMLFLANPANILSRSCHCCRINYRVSPCLKKLSVSWHGPFTERIQFRYKHVHSPGVWCLQQHFSSTYHGMLASLKMSILNLGTPILKPAMSKHGQIVVPQASLCKFYFPLTKIVLLCYILQRSLAM